MKRIKIKTTDIFLEDLGKGQGKIIVSDDYQGSYSYTWGAMGCSLAEFINHIDNDYFANKLIPARASEVFCAKRSTTALRKEIKAQIPWYQWMPAQKELREKIKELEYCDTDRDFVEMAQQLTHDIYCDMEPSELREFKETMSGILTEPWLYIATNKSPQYKFLVQIHNELKAQL